MVNSTPDLSGVTILQIIPQLETGGAERTTLEVGKAIVAAGGRSLVVSEGGPMTQELTRDGSTHIEMPVSSKNPMLIAANGQALAKLITDEGVSIIHARSRAPAWSAFQAARKTGIKYVTTYHGIYWAKSSLKRLYNSVMARGDAVIANSDYTAAAVRDAYGEKKWFPDEDHFITIPRGADLSRFDPDALTADRKAAALAAFGGAEALRILLPGRLTEWKGQEVLLNAAFTLQKREGAVPFRVVLTGSAQGRDEYEAHLRALTEELGLTHAVHIHGHWDDMPAAYDWADVTVSASTRPEAFGRVAVESQAMGTPVIASAHGGALETIADGETGWLTPPGDADALAQALHNFMHLRKDAKSSISAAARARAVSLFSTEAMTAATLCVYKRLIQGQGSE
ncbi:glycosyltransferase family 4 protein [Parvularcula marina]|uniref:Glycosyltransferase n=1 Tax=Parvularcula marina TaxID=2292771 RepID=A0A371RHV1_9PROT|nr:glycosyltransferase family 4 protein [Parvularcula marina]RFB05029.1 glycosyltransferase [Parvularcula marina]